MTTLTAPDLTETERMLVELRHIGANPYQTRLTDDPAHIAALAEDLLANGLLQVPLARPEPILNGVYQLAFGHSRLAAFKLLVEQGHSQFGVMPIDVRPLTDRQMSDMAAAENARRKNLTAIETAAALQARIQAFKLTQAEAGQPFGLGQGAVANLLRLLALPQGMQDLVHNGELPERIARQLATLAKAAPKEVERIGKLVAKAKPAERDETFVELVGDYIRDEGRDMRNAAFAPDWPLIPIIVERPTGDQPVALVACTGCQHYYRHDWQQACCMPACFDLKHAAALQEKLQAAAKKLGLPAADEDQKTFPVVSGNRSWKRSERLGELVKAAKANPDLGLVLVEGAESAHFWERVTGSVYIQIHTTAPNVVNEWFAAKDHKNGSNGTGKAVVLPPAPADPSKPETPAQQAKREAAEAAAKEAERQAQEERRRERGLALKNEADVVWLIQSYVATVAPQLTISGHVLRYAAERWIGRGMGRGRAAEFAGLTDWYDELQSQAEQAGQGKDADGLRRQLVVAAEIFEHCLGSFGDKATFGRVVDELADLAGAGGDEPGFGVKLPAEWNKPPIHETDGNCWHCGRFASQRGKLTKAELDSGWQAIGPGGIRDVRCPDCKDKPAPKAAAAKKKKGGKK